LKRFRTVTVYHVAWICRYQNGNRGLHGADVLKLVETLQEEEQDPAQMDRVALVWVKMQKYAISLNVQVAYYTKKKWEKGNVQQYLRFGLLKCYICRNLETCWNVFCVIKTWEIVPCLECSKLLFLEMFVLIATLFAKRFMNNDAF